MTSDSTTPKLQVSRGHRLEVNWGLACCPSTLDPPSTQPTTVSTNRCPHPAPALSALPEP